MKKPDYERSSQKSYDTVVIGGGHAGCEAALSSARLGCKTLLVTGDLNRVASMPCNPSIGGPAKGIVVREIDALGGEMARITDQTHIQVRMLNESKGPAVRALRAQSDKHLYSRKMKETLLSTSGIDVIEMHAESLRIQDMRAVGVKLVNGRSIAAKTVILATGTYLRSKVLMGFKTTWIGPDGQKPTFTLSPQLEELGFSLKRLKTGTPPRLLAGSIDFSKTERQDGDSQHRYFQLYGGTAYNLSEQVPCHLTYTSSDTHKIILENLGKSSMYSGVVEGVGPRYCPSIEDKIVRFKDKPRHQIFLEPESRESDEIYVQGFSTSMPANVQEAMIHSVPGLENALFSKYGYAIEYDAIDARALWPSLESKSVENLFFAGQINGTSGYEEAAGQGLVAGINAVRKNRKLDPLVLRRDQAYIGVLIDDLVTKGTTDPYRLLTSRAEHRLLLRHDNADERLMEIGREYGPIPIETYEAFKDRQRRVKTLKDGLKSCVLSPSPENNHVFGGLSFAPLKKPTTLYDLVKRPNFRSAYAEKFPEFVNQWDEEIYDQADIDIKYEGYIAKAQKQAERILKMENMKIPSTIDYTNINHMANEAREKLEKIRPLTVGQATRISGVNPSDISILLLHLRKIKEDRLRIE